MKKQVVIGCALLGAVGIASLQAKETVVYDDCSFCGGGSLVIDEDPIIIEETSSGCAFCDGYSTSTSVRYSSSGSSSSSSWNSGTGWSRATSKRIYVVDGGGAYVGIATVTTGKKSSKGKVAVKIAFKMASGKSATASKTSFTPAEDGTITATWSSVKHIGAVSMMITEDGDISGTAGAYTFVDEYETEADDGEESVAFTHGEHTFSVDATDFEMPKDGYDLISETVPSEVLIITSNSKSWNCGKSSSLKYQKVKEDGETSYELVGLDNENATNYSGLKIKYNSKKGTFSGSFKVYASNEASVEKGKPKLKSYTFTFSGSISGGSGSGVATCKKLKASWPITIE